MQKDRIIFVITSLDSGGIENYLLRYLKFDSQVEPIIICKSGKGGELEYQYLEYVSKNNIIKCKQGYFNIISWISLYKVLKRNKSKTVCDFTGNFAGISLLCAYFAGVKSRLVFYRGSTNHFKETKLRLFYNYLMKIIVQIFATKVLSNSKAALDFFYPKWMHDTEKYEVIYNGIDSVFCDYQCDKKPVRSLLKIPDNAFVVGHSGRYNIAKNHETIIEVAIVLCKKYDSIYFILVGKGTDTELFERVKAEGLDDRILLLGYRNDVKILLKGMDIFYFPSITEGQPNSLIEAMVSGLPIVASNIEPIRESVPEFFDSMLLAPLDRDKAVERIEQYYHNKKLREEAILESWAKEKYASDKLFNMFKRNLH